MSPDTDIRARVCDEARRWLGTPWHHRARVIGAGVDCAQLVLAVYESVGLLQPGQIEPGEYPPDWHLHRSDERILGHVLSVARPVAEPAPGDVALFSFGRCASHAAIVLSPGIVLHAYAQHGAVVISDLSTSAALSSRLVGYYTIFDEVSA